MRRVLLGAVLALSSGCAAQVWLSRPLVIEEYVTAHVRIYRADRDCRIEVVTPTETVITLPTRCLSVPHRRTP